LWWSSKARFDEEANINWAEMLESVGAAGCVRRGRAQNATPKMMLITAAKDERLRRYGHLSTGNYRTPIPRACTPTSATSRQTPPSPPDMEHVFVHLASQSRLPRLRKLWMAPFDLHRNLIAKIDALALAAASGTACRMVAKMNALTDEALIHSLMRAGQQGVKIDLIVRGACMLPAQVHGLTDNIRVRSLVGRFLEHSRVFYFRAGDVEESVPLQRRLDESQHGAARRTGLAGDRSAAAPAHRRRMPGGLPARQRRRLEPGGRRKVHRARAVGKSAHGAQQALMRRYGASGVAS